MRARSLRILFFALLLAIVASGNCWSQRTYTTDADFDQGVMVAVQHASVHNQLQLDPDQVDVLPFIWVPNDNGTISKVSTVTGSEVGRYHVTPPNLPPTPGSSAPNFGSPSRTTVGLDGSCWVGCRTAGTVVKIGLLEAGQWIDRNGDGIVQTSRDADNDGVITDGEILPWGEDECVLYEVVLVPGHEGAHFPGTYAGPYDTDDVTGTSPCALAIDSNNDLWVGTGASDDVIIVGNSIKLGLRRYWHITGARGGALPTQITISDPIDFTAYPTTVTAQVEIGATTVACADTTNWLPSGTAFVGVDNISYTSIVGNVLTGCTGVFHQHPVGATVFGQGHVPRGAVIDRHGILWSAGQHGDVVRMEISANPVTSSRVMLSHGAYGLGLDYLDHLFVTGFTANKMSRINVVTSAVDWTKSAAGLSGSRGVLCTKDNNVWVANSFANTVTRYDNNGNLIASVAAGAEPTGVAVDEAGSVWACDHLDEFVYSINPATNLLSIIKVLPGTIGHYSYSDMTGSISRTITTNVGTWTVIYDSGRAATGWGRVSWNNQPGDPDSGVYPGTSLSITVRSSEDLITFSAAETAANGVPLRSTPAGRYIQVVVAFQKDTGTQSPVLYDLTVAPLTVERHAALLQAYCGNSKGTVRDYSGFAGRGLDDLIVAVPGVLCIVPGNNSAGAVNWSNYVSAAPAGISYTVTNVILKKDSPRVEDCVAQFPGKSVYQQGTKYIRRWWPVLYEVPGTKWTLTITYRTAIPWDDDGAGPHSASITHQDVWDWTVSATLDSIVGAIEVFHTIPLGGSQTPVISDEVLYVALKDKLAAIKGFVDSKDTANAGDALLDFVMTVEDACIGAWPVHPYPTGFGTGIANTCENPACCKLLADADYVGKALGLFR